MSAGSIMATRLPERKKDPYFQCWRCGYKTAGRADPNRTCLSCQMVEAPLPIRTTQVAVSTRLPPGVRGSCIAHRGLFDDDDNPLNPHGDLFRPGDRLCGHRDCIRLEHIDGWVDETGERLVARTALTWNRAMSAEQVLEIRATFAEGKTTLTRLGELYGITRSTIGQILDGVTYADVGGPIRVR